MKTLREQTVDTYNNSAEELATYFKGIGSRTKDIDIAIELCPTQANPNVLEIGCGDGRDAEEIVKRTTSYVGFDISSALIKLAQAKVPRAHFEVADATTFNYPSDLDIVFAFASLLHLDKEEVGIVMKKVEQALKPGGIFYISLKLAPKYEHRVKQDQFGTRLFYFYNPKLITELAGSGFESVQSSTGFVTVGNTEWFEIALRKKKHEDL